MLKNQKGTSLILVCYVILYTKFCTLHDSIPRGEFMIQYIRIILVILQMMWYITFQMMSDKTFFVFVIVLGTICILLRNGIILSICLIVWIHTLMYSEIYSLKIKTGHKTVSMKYNMKNAKSKNVQQYENAKLQILSR